MADKELSPKDIKKMQKEVEQINKFISEIEKMGGEVPKPLKKSLKHLEVAINTGVDLGESAEEASKALAEYNNNLMKACDTVDDEMKMVCEAQIVRKWQLRNVQFTLSYKNPDSVSAKFLQKTVKRYTPEIICKHWDYCAKVDKKAKKSKK